MGLPLTDESGILACAVARDVRDFDLLIEDMESELGEEWGGLDFHDGLTYIRSPEARSLDFITVAVNRSDEDDLGPASSLITAAKEAGIKIILVANDLSPMALHHLLRLGADDFAPYPLPEGALHDAITRVRANDPAPAHLTEAPDNRNRNGVVIPVYGVAGGTGSTTMAVNLAWEIALLGAKNGYKVCILDLDLQTGSVSTYLDLPRREMIFELLTDTESMDDESFSQAMLSFNDKLDVLTAPADALPLEILTSEDVSTILDKATSLYDFVIIDLPKTLVQWTETILNRADIFLALTQIDMRCAQNTLRLIRTLKAEDLPHEKLRYILNFAPKFTDLTARSRVKRMAENLNIDLDTFFPDGGKQVTQACDHGLPIAETAARNPLRKEIAKLATSIFELATEKTATA